VKFVLLTQYYPPEVGGAQVLMSSLASELQRQSHEVKVITALPNYPTGQIFEGYGGRLCMQEVRDSVELFRTWAYPVQTARMIPRLINYISFCISAFLAFFWMGKPDVIFVDSPPLFLGLTAMVMARLRGARWVMNVSDLWPDAVAESGLVNSGFLLRMARVLEHFLYESADFVCTVTEGIYKILLEQKRVPRAKLLFLPIGVDIQLFRPRSPNHELLEKLELSGESVFLYAGTIGHAQGLTLLLDAADYLRERTDIVVAFVGDGPVKSDLIAESRRRELKNVVFAAPVPLAEMPLWWSISRGALVTLKDQAVHQSARPSKSLPALASGVPVIFSGYGEMAKIIGDAKAGIVVPPEQVGLFVDAIVQLADDPALAHKLGENGRGLCENEFSWQKVVQQWLADIRARLPETVSH
jgi:colanic acid biosynthesis glycosyl transferase WcaI